MWIPRVQRLVNCAILGFFPLGSLVNEHAVRVRNHRSQAKAAAERHRTAALFGGEEQQKTPQ